MHAHIQKAYIQLGILVPFVVAEVHAVIGMLRSLGVRISEKQLLELTNKAAWLLTWSTEHLEESFGKKGLKRRHIGIFSGMEADFCFLQTVFFSKNDLDQDWLKINKPWELT